MSRMTKLSCVMIAVAAMTSACAVNDELPPQPPKKMAQPQLECVDPSMIVLQNYFQGQATEPQVHQAWRCFDGAIRKFALSTKGANPNYYTANELRTFFQTYYLDGKPISDAFLTDLMRLKQLLIGGDEKTLAKSDLDALRRSFDVLEAESVRMLPFIPVLLAEEQDPDLARTKPEFVESMLSSLVLSTTNLGHIFERNSIAYTFDDMKSLLHNLSLFVGDWPAPEKAIQYLPTLSVAKEFIVGGPTDRISRSELMPFMQRIGRLFAIQLRASYFLKGYDVAQHSGLAQFERTLNETYSLLTDVAKSQPRQTITFAQTEHLLNEFENLKILPKDFPRKDAHKAFQLFVRRILAKDMKAEGVTLNVITSLQNLTSTFITRQKLWQEIKLSSVQKGRRSDEALPVQEVKAMWAERGFVTDPISRLLDRRRPATFTRSGVLRLNNGSATIDDAGFMRMNLISLVQGLLFESYARKSAMTQKEFAAIFGDFFETAVKFKILQPKDKDLKESAFNEAGLFTLDSRSDDRMSEFEFFDYVAEVSGAGVMSGRAYKDLGDSCRAIGRDYFKRPTYESSCFKKQASRHFDEYFVELPEWVRLSDQMAKQGRWSEFGTALEEAAREKDAKAGETSNSDLTRITMVMQYIETLYVRFDKNRDDELNYEEAHEALPLFEKILKEASGFDSERKIEALFMYILAKGRAPTSVGDKIDFVVSWSRKPDKWREHVHADRNRLLNVVAAMK